MKIIKAVTGAARWLVMIAIVLMMLLTVTDVVLRQIFKSPILGVMEYSQMIMAIILLATASTGMEDGHIKVDLVVSRLPQKAQLVLEIITLVLSVLTSLLIASSALKAGLTAMEDNLHFLTVKVSQAPFILLYALGLLVLVFACVCLIYNAVRRLKEK